MGQVHNERKCAQSSAQASSRRPRARRLQGFDCTGAHSDPSARRPACPILVVAVPLAVILLSLQVVLSALLDDRATAQELPEVVQWRLRWSPSTAASLGRWRTTTWARTTRAAWWRLHLVTAMHQVATATDTHRLTHLPAAARAARCPPVRVRFVDTPCVLAPGAAPPRRRRCCTTSAALSSVGCPPCSPRRSPGPA